MMHLGRFSLFAVALSAGLSSAPALAQGPYPYELAPVPQVPASPHRIFGTITAVSG
ncbi:MAG: hypothetical protein ACLPYS_01940 [Vulcanimicrobiaceae bacterium]|jgi:hypothetical protein